MFKIQRIDNGVVVLVVMGRLQTDAVDVLCALVASEAAGESLALDLKELVLADRQALRFLRDCEARGIELRNCPGYVRASIGKGSELD